MDLRVSGTRPRIEPLAPRGRALLLLLLVAASALLVVEPGRVALFEPDEGRYAEIPREMIASGDWVTPRLDGFPYFEKPPLHYWLVAASFELFGQSEATSRLPIKAASLGMVLLTLVFARRRWGERVGILAALVTASSLLVVAMARVNVIDPPLSLALTGAAFSFCAFQEAERAGNRARATLALYGLHLSCAAAVMLKGLIGLVLPGGAIVVWALATGSLRLVPRLFSPGPLALFLVLTVPWHVLVARRNPGFLDFYFVNEHFKRFLSPGHRRSGSRFYFVGVLLAGLLPWTGFLGRIGLSFPGRGRTAWRDRATEGYLWSFSVLVFLFFTVSRSKLVPYILPIWPALAVLLAIGIERARVRGAAFLADRRITAGFYGLLLAGVLAAGYGGRYAERFGVEGPAALLVAALALGFLLNLPWPFRGRPRPVALSTERLAVTTIVPWLLFLGGAVWALPTVARQITPWPLVKTLLAEARPGDLVFQRGAYLEVIPPYLGRLTPIVDLGWSELDFGRPEGQKKGLLPTPEEFARLWNGEGRVLAVVHFGHLASFTDPKLPLNRPIYLGQTPNGKYLLFANRS